MGGFKRAEIERDDARGRPLALAALAGQAIDVFCRCNRCGHNATRSTALLIGELGPACPVPEVGASMRCGSCGSRDIATRPDWPATGPVAWHGDTPGPGNDGDGDSIRDQAGKDPAA